jgi:hypothetical protein
VTTGEVRLANLKEITEETIRKFAKQNQIPKLTRSYWGRFWFTTFDALLQAEDVLHDQIWRIAGREDFHPLIW